jgi:toxin YhaV
MDVNGWRLFQHPLFKSQFDMLLADAERLKAQQPETFREHKTVKLLAKITHLISEEIPADPGHDRWNQGNTLGKEYRHWKRAKFGRYRLFFRYHGGSDKKAIMYVWVNDEKILRKVGDKNDPYEIFARHLEHGEPPNSFDELLKNSIALRTDEFD